MKNKLVLVISILATLGHSLANAEDFAIPTFQEATAMVKDSLQSLEISTSKAYCTKGTMTCRTMYQLKDKVTGQPSNIYYDTFYSADRQVGSTCYFIPTQADPTKYYVFTDAVFDGKLEIGIISPYAATIQASADFKNVVFGNLKSPKIGTTLYSLSSFTQNEEVVILEGMEYDSTNPEYKNPKHVEYYRMNP